MSASATTTESENKALIRRWIEEVWNHGREELIEQMRAPDTIATGLGEGTQKSRGQAPFKAFYNNLRGTFRDLHLKIEDIIAEGDKVVVRFSAEGTHTGGLLAPATGRKVGFAGIIIARIANSKIAESWNNIDQLGLFRQIGALPSDSGLDRFLTTRQ
jgi:predicted ester cyclase